MRVLHSSPMFAVPHLVSLSKLLDLKKKVFKISKSHIYAQKWFAIVLWHNYDQRKEICGHNDNQFFHFEVERNVFMSYAMINSFGAVGGGVSKALVIMIVRIGCYGLKSWVKYTSFWIWHMLTWLIIFSGYSGFHHPFCVYAHLCWWRCIWCLP